MFNLRLKWRRQKNPARGKRCRQGRWITAETRDAVYLGLLQYVDGVHVVPHRVNDDQHVSELGRDDPAPVVPGVLRPDDVHLVVAKVS